MSKRHRGSKNPARPLLLVTLLASLGGCAPDELPLPPVVWEGDDIRARMDDPGLQVCGGSFEALDRHAQLVRDALLLEGDAIIEYSIGDQEFVNAPCARPLATSPAGCASLGDGYVFTTEPFHPHEIVHALRILDPLIDRLRSPVFEEGLAVAFGSDTLGNGIGPLDVADLFADQRIGGSKDLFRAGHTVAALLDRHGAAAFRRFDTLARSMNEEDAFEAAFGETKDQFAAVTETLPLCEQSQWYIPLLECDGEPITADPDTGLITFTGNLSCPEADVQGPDFGRMWTSRHFRLDGRTSIFSSYQLDMPEDITFEIVSCHGGCPERFAYEGTRYQITSYGNGIADLQPGDYFLRLSRPVSDDDGHFEITIDPLPL